MSPTLLIAGYSVLIVCSSLIGGQLPSLIHWSHRRMQFVLSFIGGLMLAISLFVLLTHSVHELGSTEQAAIWTLIGMLAMFFLIRSFHFHQHDFPDSAAHAAHEGCDHDHQHAHSHQHSHDASPVARRKGSLTFLGIAFGLGLHTLIDGIALAAAVQSAAQSGAATGLAGAATFLAIALHKPLDALSITSVMAADGWSTRAQSLANLLFAAMVPLGAGLFLLSLDRFHASQQTILGCALAFSAGAFLCIALSDLLPEIQFHSHDRLGLSAMLLFGVVLGYGVSRLESHEHHAHSPALPESHSSPGHNHSHSHTHAPHDEAHDHEGHKH